MINQHSLKFKIHSFGDTVRKWNGKPQTEGKYSQHINQTKIKRMPTIQ